MLKLILLPALTMLIAAAPSPLSAQPASNQVVSGDRADAQPVAPVAGGGETTITPESKICRRLEQSYSRQTQKVCLTRDQWKKVDADTQ